MPVRVKICGLMREVDIQKSIESGADAVGFIFGYPNSPRNLNSDQLKELISKVPPYVSTVVVSPSSNPGLVKTVREIRPTLVQLYGDSNNHLQHVIGVRGLIQTVLPVDEGENTIKECHRLAKNCAGIFFDASSHYGTEEPNNRRLKYNLSNNWTLCRRVHDELFPFPLILAGGLNDENVQNAIEIARPFAVDVSSGVESSPGVKDEIKLERFIRIAKSVIY